MSVKLQMPQFYFICLTSLVQFAYIKFNLFNFIHSVFPKKCSRHCLLLPSCACLTCFIAAQGWIQHRWPRRSKPLWRGLNACWRLVCLWDCWRAKTEVSQLSILLIIPWQSLFPTWKYVILNLSTVSWCLPAGQKPVYENTDLAVRFLRSDASYSLHGYIQHCNNTVWPIFSHLESAVLEGSHQHEKAFGKKTNDLFQVIDLKFTFRFMHIYADKITFKILNICRVSLFKGCLLQQ